MMNNLKREFLYSDTNKYIPIQLTRTVNGVSSSETSFQIESISERTITIKVPIDSSCMAFMIKEESNKVVSVKISPPGIDNIKFNLIPEGCNIYVVSKEYEDGYISEDSTIIGDSDGGRLILSSADEELPSRINLSETMVKSFDESDLTQWYNYTDHYTGELIWESPDFSFDNIPGGASYLLTIRETLLCLIGIFRSNNSTTLLTNDNQGSIRMLKTMSDIAKFMKRYVAGLTESTNGEINTYFEYLDSQFLPLNDQQGHQYFDDELYNKVAAAGVFNHYISQSRTNWDSNYNLYTDTCMKILDRQELDLYIPMYKQDSEAFNKLDGITFNKKRPGVPSGPLDTIGGPQIRGYVDSAYNNNLKTYLPSHNVPVFNTGGAGDASWWGQIENISKVYYENVWEYLNESLAEVEQQIIQAGRAIWGVGEEDSPESQPGQNEVMETLDWLEPTGDSAFVIRGNNSLRFSWTTSSFHPGLSSVEWGEFENSNFMISYPNGYPNIPPTVNHNVEIGNLIPGTEYFVRLRTMLTTGLMIQSPMFRITTLESGQEIVDGNTVLLDDLNDVTIVEPMDRDNLVFDSISQQWVNVRSDGTSPGDNPDRDRGSNYPVAHEATLQNIRFLKNMINALNSNTWSTTNHANSMIITKLLDIETSVLDGESSNSLLNITSPIVENGDVEIVYSKIVDGSVSEWIPLPTNVGSIGKDGIININLNSEEFEVVGKYVISVRPRKLTVNILEISNGIVKINSMDEDLDQYNDRNYFYGWNIQLINPQNGLKIGRQKIINGSLWSTDIYQIRVDQDNPELRENIRAEIWGDLFIPVIVDLDIVEHNNLTLSYSLYGRKEMNTNNGLATIYDHTGNVYRQFSYGTYSNDATGGAIIEYRDPTPTSGSDG